MMLCSPTSLPSCLQSSLASERALDGQPSYPWWQKAAGPGTLGGHSPRGILSHHPWSHFPCLRDVQSSPSLLSRETQHPDALGGGGGVALRAPPPRSGITEDLWPASTCLWCCKVASKALHSSGGLRLGAGDTSSAPLGCHPSHCGTWLRGQMFSISLFQGKCK